MSSLIKAYISRAALRHNFRIVLAKSRGARVCAVVKANAYGHGAPLVIRALAGLEVACWAVATLNEAQELQQAGIRKPILIFRPLDAYAPAKTLRAQLDLILAAGWRATVTSQAGLDMLAAAARRRRRKALYHLKIDTGMGRNGCGIDEAQELIQRSQKTPGLKLEGLYSHFAWADAPDLTHARQQWVTFKSLLDNLGRTNGRPICHMANSAAIFNLPAARLDMVRTGRALYGFGSQLFRGADGLRPALRLEAPLVAAKWLRRGQSCGYGATFVARRKTRLGILPIGYADGYSRRCSNAGWVDFQGQRAPVIGRVCMDFTLVDLTDVRGAELGSAACLISDRPQDPHSAEAIANRLETIPHEIVSVLGNRVQRVLKA